MPSLIPPKWPLKKILNIKALSLTILSIQTSTMVLVLRYSRTAKQPYLVSTAVLLSEILKIIISLCLLFLEGGGSIMVMWDKIVSDVFSIGSSARLFIPAALYVVQNNLLFIALTNLDAATYQVTYQLKILTTAVFSWVMLGRRLNIVHWISLALLMTGVSLVQIEEVNESVTSKQSEDTSKEPCSYGVGDDSHCDIQTSWLLGILAVLISCISSGFSGVYFEKIIKTGLKTSLFVRNLQLGMFSVVFCMGAVLLDRDVISKYGFLQGYTISAWTVVIIQAFGGLVVSVTMKYADNILKGFATSISIITSTLVSWLILGEKAPTLQFVFGASIVIGATFIYGLTPLAKDTNWLPAKENGVVASDNKVSIMNKRRIFSV